MSEQENNFGKIAILGIGTVMVLGGIIFALTNQSAPIEEPTQTAMVPTEAASTTPVPTLTGTVAAETETVIRYEGVEGETALDLLKMQEDVVTQDSDFGEYVESINGIEAGTDDKYWLFYVNGEMASVGAADYVTEEGEMIEWRFE